MENFNCHDRVTVFIESPGKASSVLSIFHKIGFYNVHVEATKGRLFDLPESEFGVNMDDFSDVHRIPINPSKMKYVSEYSGKSRADLVFILTDDDIEGEVIASDIINSSDSSAIYRLKVNRLNPESLISAIKIAGDIDQGMVDGGISRRTFDRIAGYYNTSFNHDDQTHGVIGRVITPTLALVRDGQLKNNGAFINRRILGSDGDFWDISIPFLNEHEALHHFNIVSALPDPEIECLSTEIQDDLTRPLSGSEALLHLSNALSEPVISVARTMQNLYESGRISYPRSDSARVSSESAKIMSRMAHHFGVSEFDPYYIQEKSALFKPKYVIQDSHEAIIPLDMNCNIFSNIESHSMEDKVLILLIRHMLRAGQKERVVEKSKGVILDNHVNRGWTSYLREYGRQYFVGSSYSCLANSKRQYINDEINTMGVLFPAKKDGNTALKSISLDVRLLELMVNYGIGRPSTIAHHANKMAGRFLSEDGQLNKLGEASYFHASRLAPGLLSYQSFAEIENILHSGFGSVNEKISEAINIAKMTVPGVAINNRNRVEIGGEESLENNFY
jgi:DNA topoisomerase IA